MTIYTTLAYSLFYLSFAAFPVAFQTVRGWSLGIASLPFLALLLGMLLGCIGVYIFTKTWYNVRLCRTKKVCPEDRLPPVVCGSFITPIGAWKGFFWSNFDDARTLGVVHIPRVGPPSTEHLPSSTNISSPSS